jgi:hypothetical protein
MKKLMVIVAALAMFAGQAVAADWNFYGSARIQTFYVNTEVIGSGTDTTQYEQNLQGNSRIGARVKVSDELSGRFEYGSGVNLRLLYGNWNFGGGNFIVGQDYAPLNWFYSDQVFDGDADLLPYGGVYSGRVGQLKLIFGGFQVALVAPNVAAVAGGATEVKVPGIEAAYKMDFDWGHLRLGGGYQTFEETNGAVETDINSWVVALGGKVNVNAFYAGANIYAGQNAGYLISIDTDANRGWADGRAGVVAGNIEDNDAVGYMIAAGYKFNDMFNMEAGYGGVKTELDNSSADDKVSSYYLNATVTLAPGVFFVPEIGRIDGDENGDREVTYGGIKWQINF